MKRLSAKLGALLLVRGALRPLAPITVIWGVVAWWFVAPMAAAVYALLTGNYVVVYVLTWVRPAAIHGPWRVRAVQTFVVLANSFAIPIVYYWRGWSLPWGFVVMSVIYHAGLVASTYILLYLQQRLPMVSVFSRQRSALLGSAAELSQPLRR
ncbi:MAG: hypothetical protein ACE5K7_01605 [Phycisphaerae bacterium]